MRRSILRLFVLLLALYTIVSPTPATAWECSYSHYECRYYLCWEWSEWGGIENNPIMWHVYECCGPYSGCQRRRYSSGTCC